MTEQIEKVTNLWSFSLEYFDWMMVMKAIHIQYEAQFTFWIFSFLD